MKRNRSRVIRSNSQASVEYYRSSTAEQEPYIRPPSTNFLPDSDESADEIENEVY